MFNLAIPQPPRNLMLGLSLAQGLALLVLWRVLSEDVWPSQTPALNFPLWTFVLVWPTLLLLSLDKDNQARTFKLVSVFSAVLVLLASYVGWEAAPFNAFPIESLAGIYVGTMLIACFMALMHLQQWASGGAPTYDALFAFSWRNFLVSALALLLTLGVALILSLWAALFNAIGIDFFEKLFTKDWFLFPVLAVSFGLGVLIFRRLVKLIDGITGLLEGLMRLLLPLAVAVVVIFLVALPFTGLTPLWGTGDGTALLMALNAFALFFLNAVYQTGAKLPYPPLVHRMLYPGIALAPILSGLALYGLYLRVDQYGWSVERCWALAIGVLLAMFSLGYAWSIVRQRDGWPQSLGRVNRIMAWAILGLMLLVNSPLLDFRSISLASQLARVEAGEIELREFDFHYARENLARPAWLKMQALIEEHESSDPELVSLIHEPLPSWNQPPTQEAVWERVTTYRPTPFEVPADVRKAIAFHYGDYILDITNGEEQKQNLVLVRTDVNGDGETDYVLFGVHPHGGQPNGFGVYRNDGEWRHIQLTPRIPVPEEADFAQTMQTGEIELVEPAFKDVKIGEFVFQLEVFGEGVSQPLQSANTTHTLYIGTSNPSTGDTKP